MSPMKRCKRLLAALRLELASPPGNDGKSPKRGRGRSGYRFLHLGAALAAALLLQACAAPITNADRRAQATAPSGATTAIATRTAQPRPQAADQPTHIQLDTTCKRDADCAVKDVGNCCGAYPACVNKDSPTDPQGVMARCQASGRMSVCGFRQIQSCECRAGHCVEATTQFVPTSPTVDPRS